MLRQTVLPFIITTLVLLTDTTFLTSIQEGSFSALSENVIPLLVVKDT